MPMSKAGRKIMANLKEQYGEKKGEGIFYAMENKGEIPGMKKMKGYAKGGDTKGKKKTEDKKKDSKTSKGRTDAQTARRRQEDLRRRMIDGLTQSSFASAGVREGSDYGNFPGTAGSRRIDEEFEARSRRRSTARRNENQTEEEDRSRRGMAKGGMVKGYAEGGMVKATGTLNTGIRKCGE